MTEQTKIEWVMLIDGKSIDASDAYEIFDELSKDVYHNFERCMQEVCNSPMMGEFDVGSVKGYRKIAFNGTIETPKGKHYKFFEFMKEAVERVEKVIPKLAELKKSIYLYVNNNLIYRELYNGMTEDEADTAELYDRTTFAFLIAAVILELASIGLVLGNFWWHDPTIIATARGINIFACLLAFIQLIILQKPAPVRRR